MGSTTQELEPATVSGMGANEAGRSASAAATPAVATAGPTSLASTGDWSQEALPDPDGSALARCPRKLGLSMVSVSTGATFPARCGAHGCSYCGPVNAAIEALAIGLAAPERAIRFSLVGEDWQTRRIRMKRLTQQLRRDGYRWEFAWHVEPNPRLTGHHSHGWQHGDYVPQAHLQERCQALGMGIPYIEKLRQNVGQGEAVGYGLKGITYGLKGTKQGADELAQYLDDNGGRLVHATRGFWRDGAESITLGEARKRVIARKASEDPGPWVLVADGSR